MISKVGKPLEELRQLVEVVSATPIDPANGAPTLATILAAVQQDDLVALRSELRHAAVMLGSKRFLVEVAHPLSVQVGELWSREELEVRHEHLLTECLIVRAALSHEVDAVGLLVTAASDSKATAKLDDAIATLARSRT